MIIDQRSHLITMEVVYYEPEPSANTTTFLEANLPEPKNMEEPLFYTFKMDGQPPFDRFPFSGSFGRTFDISIGNTFASGWRIRFHIYLNKLPTTTQGIDGLLFLVNSRLAAREGISKEVILWKEIESFFQDTFIQLPKVIIFTAPSRDDYLKNPDQFSYSNPNPEFFEAIQYKKYEYIEFGFVNEKWNECDLFPSFDELLDIAGSHMIFVSFHSSDLPQQFHSEEFSKQLRRYKYPKIDYHFTTKGAILILLQGVMRLVKINDSESLTDFLFMVLHHYDKDGSFKRVASSILLDSIKGTALLRDKFSDLLTVVQRFIDQDGIAFLIRKLFDSIKNTTLIKDNFLPLLSIVKKMSSYMDRHDVFLLLFEAIKGSSVIKDHYLDLLLAWENLGSDEDIQEAFLTLLAEIKQYGLIKDSFSDLLAVVEHMSDRSYKCNTFFTLLAEVKGTTIMDTYSAQLSSIFTNLLTMIESRRELFFDFLVAIRGTTLIRDNFTDLVKVVDTYGNHMMFSTLLREIHDTDLIKEYFIDLLAMVERIPATQSDYDELSDLAAQQSLAEMSVVRARYINYKCSAFSELMTEVKHMTIIEDYSKELATTFFILLTAIEDIADEYDKYYAFSTLLEGIKATTTLMSIFEKRINSVFSILLAMIEKEPQYRKKINNFLLLMKAAKGTVLMDFFSKEINAIFSIMLREVKNSTTKQGKEILILIESTKDTILMEKFLSKISSFLSTVLKAIEEMPENESKIFQFCKLLEVIKNTPLMSLFSERISSLFSTTLTIVENNSDTRYKSERWFSDLLKVIKDTFLIDTFSERVVAIFSSFLKSVETCQQFSTFFIAIKDTNLSTILGERIHTATSKLLSAVEESKDDGYRKSAELYTLIQAIKKTVLMNNFSERIYTTFSKVLNEIEQMPYDIKKREAVRNLLRAAENTPLWNSISSQLIPLF